MIEDVLRKCDELNEDAEARLRELLAIESVSTDPAYQPEIARAADWVKRALEQAGLEARIVSGEGHPVVLAHAPAERVANPHAPPVLFYGHYDVQPPDPMEKWASPPFEPTIRESVDGPAVFARGACDDKGQVMCFLEALRAYREAGEKLPGPVTVLIEGEEECGSVGLAPMLERHKDELAAAACLVSDTSMWDAAASGGGPKPAICYGLRGLLYFDLQLHGPARDLHSGVYGGTIANPATEIVRVLGNLFDENHRVAVPGFYDDVLDADESEQARWDELGFDEQQYVESIGLKAPFGEAGRTTLERRWSRPSCDINGLYGGYMGEGGKTVIPTFAGIKVSFRLAAEQDAAKIAAAFREWIESHDVGSLTWQITQHGQAHPVAVPTDSPQIRAVSAAVENETGEPPAMVREGATIPVVADFKTVLGLDTILLGFGLNSDNIHSPDEHFALRRYHLGRRTYVRALAELGAASM